MIINQDNMQNILFTMQRLFLLLFMFFINIYIYFQDTVHFTALLPSNQQNSNANMLLLLPFSSSLLATVIDKYSLPIQMFHFKNIHLLSILVLIRKKCKIKVIGFVTDIRIYVKKRNSEQLGVSKTWVVALMVLGCEIMLNFACEPLLCR